MAEAAVYVTSQSDVVQPSDVIEPDISAWDMPDSLPDSLPDSPQSLPHNSPITADASAQTRRSDNVVTECRYSCTIHVDIIATLLHNNRYRGINVHVTVWL